MYVNTKWGFTSNRLNAVYLSKGLMYFLFVQDLPSLALKELMEVP